ncbi:MAG: hypothetical protein A3G93_13330 [Nitrospinae bacterium RIFCSPLOWO2_12_FULL_45_22]|nr:MAG: hypothetical protein A3G93_13330 [Nitrospinae bacterium RIFCSPLOWO2_12_FULL_45_22]
MFAPVLGCFHLILSHPIKVIRLLFLSTVPYLSLMVVCVTGVLSYILTGKAAFLVTGEKGGGDTFYNYAEGSGGKTSWLERLNFEHGSVRITELILGVFLTYICLRTFNLALLAFSLSLVLGYFLFICEWENKILTPLVYLPFLLIVFGIGLLGFNLMGAQGIFLLFFPIHF